MRVFLTDGALTSENRLPCDKGLFNLSDDFPLGLLFGLLALLILLSAFFSSSETGMMSINRYRLSHQANSGDSSAQRVLRLLSRHPKR